MMRTISVALLGALLAAPAAGAAEADDPPSPARTALRAPVGVHFTVAEQMRVERYENVQEDLTARGVQLAGRLHIEDERRRLRGQPPGEIRERIRDLERRVTAPPAPAVPPVLEAIADCESGGDPTAIGGGGAFRGKYQFSPSTWASVGGTGDPAQAPEAEQDRRAAILYAREGPSPWPVCGR